MDFSYTSEQDALRESVRRFTERQYGWEQRFEIVRAAPGEQADHWPTFAELGWLGAGLTEDEGGFGGGSVENALIAEEFGRALVIEPFVSHVIATRLLVSLAADEAAELVAGAVMGERRIVAALGEADGRGDLRVISTRASAAGDGTLLNGAKSLVDGASAADFFIISAREGDEVGLYLVDATAPGIRRRDYRTLDNHRVSDLVLDKVASRRLASGKQAEAAIEAALDHADVTLCGEALGIMDAALWATRDYLKMRKQFGTTLNNFQALQHRMADMLIEVELSRSILFHALGAVEGGDPVSRRAAVAAAKVQAAHGGLHVTSQAIQLHGGIGVTEELNISHYYRRLYVISRLLGDIDHHIDRFAAATDMRDEARDRE